MPPPPTITIIGAGAAGLMAAISAGRALGEAGQAGRVVLLDGSKKVGVKILVAGGGRCNVTHYAVDEKQYAGTSRNTIRRVLRSFGVDDTVAFFEELGVTLKREDTGKLFPTTDKARTVLDALLDEVRRLGVDLVHPWRVAGVDRDGDGFVIHRADSDETLRSDRLVLCTGGMALPRSGSDGAGYGFVQGLGHTVTPRVFAALVPLIAGPGSSWLTELSGVSCRAAVEVRSGTGKRLARFENDLLCTHFGLSGPAPMDASRYLTAARHNDPGASMVICWIDRPFEQIDADLQGLGQRTPLTYVREHLPERLARALCERAGVDPATPGNQLSRDGRRALAHLLAATPVEISGDRGFAHAEVTAGGVPLGEINPATMASRTCENLWLAGEILDVDGRIGGFNFQWAWASGWLAGRSVAASVSGAGLLQP
ncbi:MAG: NAD(P)/FAD-dependent oxidoreductase [Phycisphaerales bacterium]|jgi:predicted Rossmann fold flavoprotein